MVYRADQDTDEVFELYSVLLDRREAPIRLSGTMANGGYVENVFRFTLDGRRVIYFADQDTNGVIELYSVPSDGRAPAVKLNGSLISAGDVISVEISPDSNQVVYRANQESEFVEALYSRPIDSSGTAVKLNGTLVVGGDVLSGFAISPDSARVVFRADSETDQLPELFSRSIDASSVPVKFNVLQEVVRAVNDPLICQFNTVRQGYEILKTLPKLHSDVTCLGIPILFTHGKQDRLVNWEGTEKLFD